MTRTSTTRRLAIAVAAILALVTMGAAAAQGFFYMEVEKDGRIYVFGQAKEYEAWSKSGEMGKSITRPGAGPNGETMIFDSEEAINLYNFKHGRPGEVMLKPEEKKPVMKFSWKDGKTTFETDWASLTISNRIQVRYTLEDPEQDGEDTTGSFRIRRAKTKLDGWIYTKDLTYEFQANWADTSNALEDANINYDFIDSRKLLQVKAGQFKVPFGRQELTSSGSQQFVDRSIVSNEFAKGRDIGLQLWGLPFDGKLDWRVGIFNGNGRNRSSNDNSKHQYNARVTWQPFGDVKYSESDFESKDKPLFAVAAQFERNDQRAPEPGGVDRTVFGGDAVFKYKGLSVFGEYYDRTNEDEAGDDTDADGFNLQAGMFAIRDKLEFALRYAAYDPNSDSPDDDRTETGLAAGWFFNKHNLKLQADYRVLKDESDPSDADTEDQFRLQCQFIF